MSGVKGRSGRKKMSLSRANAQRRMALLAPIAVEVIRETIEGINTDRLRYEASAEVYNHNFGKPRQQTDIDLTGGDKIGAGLVVELMQILTEKRRELESGDIVEGEIATKQEEE